ncbi:MAG: TPR end-of-group domain-containing protein, partial [Chitinophagales bacterium]
IMQKDEQAALSMNKRYVSVLKQYVSAHGGEILNDYGDGSLCSFTSATEAVRCAIEMQEQFRIEPIVPLRVGLHIGEILFEDGKVLGDGVNVASRIQSLGVANSILFSNEIHSKLANQPSLKCLSLGKFQFKNVDTPMEVFALANEGLVVPDRKKMEGKLQEKESKNKKVFLFAAALFLLLISIFVYRQFFYKAGFTGLDKSIAVLPLESLPQTKDSEWINDGFTQAVIDKLSRLTGLNQVTGWARVKAFRSSTKTLKDIAEELGVSAILSWTIQKQPDRYRIHAELIDASTSKDLWSEEFDGKRSDPFTLETEVAEKIASSLSTRISPEEKIGLKKQYTDNAEAWGYYLRGRFFWDTRTPAGYDSAKLYYDKAIALDPNYALAYAGLADLYTFNSFGLTQKEAVPHARDLVNKALELDSTLVPALASLGFIQGLDYDWKKAMQTLQKAIRLDPKYTFAHVFYGNLLIFTRENERGIEQHKIALSLEPLSAQVNWIMGRTYFQTGKYDLAEAQLRKTLKLFPANSQLPRLSLIWLLLIQKRYPEAFELINQVPVKGKIVNMEYRGTVLAYAYASMEDTIRAKKELAKTIAENNYKLNYFLARDYVALKDYNMAINYLEKANEERELWVGSLKIDTAMAPLRNDPRFKALLKKMNLEQSSIFEL